MTARLASLHSIVKRTAEVLGTDVLESVEIADRLVAMGLQLGHSPIDTLVEAIMDDDKFIEVDDDRWIHVRSQLNGLRWMLDLGAAADDELPLSGMLQLLADWPYDAPIDVVDVEGNPIGVAELTETIGSSENALIGPSGWLKPFAGRSVELRLVDGTITLAPIDHQPAPSPALAAALRRAFDRRREHGVMKALTEDQGDVEFDITDLTGLLIDALVHDRAAFLAGPIPCSIEPLLASAQLDPNGYEVGEMGTDWTAVRAARRRAALASIYGLDESEVECVEVLMGASRIIIAGDPDALGEDPDEHEGAAVLLSALLARASVCRAFLGEHMDRETTDGELLTFAEALLEWVDDGPASGGPAYIASMALDRLGRPDEAEAMAVMGTQHDLHPLAARVRAGFLADRGNARGAMDLLKQIGVTLENEDDDGELAREVAPFAARPKQAVNRNDPCPCGSGRKYKACHLGKELHPLSDRAAWLHRKAMRYVRTHARLLDARIAREIASATGGDHRVLMRLLGSELVADLTLCEGGVFNEFIARRSALLPDDEALLATGWAMVERSLYEVIDVRGTSWTMRDVRTGDRLEISNLAANHRVGRGSHVIGRPLPVENELRSFGGFVPVGGRLVDEALDILDRGDALEVAELLGRCFAPPVIQNTDSHHMNFHELTWRVTDQTEARAALVRAGMSDAGDQFVLTRGNANNDNTVIATF